MHNDPAVFALMNKTGLPYDEAVKQIAHTRQVYALNKRISELPARLKAAAKMHGPIRELLEDALREIMTQRAKTAYVVSFTHEVTNERIALYAADRQSLQMIPMIGTLMKAASEAESRMPAAQIALPPPSNIEPLFPRG